MLVSISPKGVTRCRWRPFKVTVVKRPRNGFDSEIVRMGMIKLNTWLSQFVFSDKVIDVTLHADQDA